MRRARCFVVAASFVTLAAACTDPGSAVGAALSSDRGSQAGSEPPTGLAGRATSITAGRADLALFGDIDASRTYAHLTTPAIYVFDVGAATLTWRTDRYESLALAGTVVVGDRPTSSSLQLQFTVQHRSTLIAFASDEGECIVAIDAAKETMLHGSFACARLTSVDDELTVRANGSFEASA
jgi:hypothetical protein